VAFGSRLNNFNGEQGNRTGLETRGLSEEAKDKLHRGVLSLFGGRQRRLCIDRAIASGAESASWMSRALDPIATRGIEDRMM
jgi:ABC-type phosphate transport system ATPase subunit